MLDDVGWKRIQDCALELPSEAAHTGLALEFRCGSRQASGDLSLLTGRGTAISKHYIQLGRTKGIDKAIVILGSLLEAASGKDPVISRDLGGVSLEYDLSDHEFCGRAPGVFLSPPESVQDHSAGYTDAERVMAVLAAAGCPEDDNNRKTLELLCANLPSGANISQCGLFLARNPPVIRINIAGIESSELQWFLDIIGWPGSPKNAIGVLAHFNDLTPVYRIALDLLNGRIAPRLGLEVFQPLENTVSGGDLGIWKRFVDRLVVRGLCLPGKANGLKAWLGWEPIFDSNGIFPTLRVLHHFKFDMREDAVEAKAYIFALMGAPMGNEAVVSKP